MNESPTPHPALPAVEAALRAAMGEQLRIVSAEPVSGGSIHTALRLQDAGGARFFAKLAPAAQAPMFEAEADGLGAIAASGSLR
ncbi:MAG TPA: fructosamine kinase family protein, partial [Thauera aminoaromatica]|nr:fructosamine kinase family protein [Thauera aminoaromatica]